MVNNKLSFFLLAFSILLGTLLSAANCQKQCQDQQDCQRVCQCDLVDINQTVTCGLGYTCNTITDLCSEDYDKNDCSDICNTYQPVGLCNSQQCNTENDCLKEALCTTTQNDGAKTSFTCRQRFECDANYKVCGASYTQTDAQALCEICLQTGTGISNEQLVQAASQ